MYRLLFVLLAVCAGGILHAQQVPGWHAQKRFELRNRGHLAVAESTLRERLPQASVIEGTVGGVVGAHVGPGMVAVGV